MDSHYRNLPSPGQLVQPGEGWHRQIAMPYVGIVLEIINPTLLNVIWRYPNGLLQVQTLNPIYLDSYRTSYSPKPHYW